MSSLSSSVRKIAAKQLDKYIEGKTFNPPPLDRDNGIYISIEGNIGVGKTTLSRGLSSLLIGKGEKCILIEETVNLDWLNAFISKPKERAGLFQIKRLCSTINAVNKMGVERSIRTEYGQKVHCIGDRLPLGNFAFALVHFASGNIDEELFKLYGTALADGGPYIYPDVLLLDVSPTTTLERIKNRDRRGESSYKLEYLEKLDEATLFVLLYVWGHGAINVVPVNWEKYGRSEDICRRLQTQTRSVPKMLVEEKDNLVNMSYSDLKELVKKLC